MQCNFIGKRLQRHFCTSWLLLRRYSKRFRKKPMSVPRKGPDIVKIRNTLVVDEWLPQVEKIVTKSGRGSPKNNVTADEKRLSNDKSRSIFSSVLMPETSSTSRSRPTCCSSALFRRVCFEKSHRQTLCLSNSNFLSRPLPRKGRTF